MSRHRAEQLTYSQAESFSKGTCVRSKLRGTFDIREAWVQELRERHQLVVEQVSSCNNCADLLTKTHSTKRCKELLTLIRSRAVKKVVQERGMLAFTRLIGG